MENNDDNIDDLHYNIMRKLKELNDEQEYINIIINMKPSFEIPEHVKENMKKLTELSKQLKNKKYENGNNT